MKILQATYVRGVAGSEKFLLNAIPALKARGHEVELLILYIDERETASFRQLLDEAGIVYHTVLIGGMKLLTSLRRVARLMKRFDVSNSHLLHADLTLSLAKRLFAPRVKLVSGKHGYEEWYNNQYGFDPQHRVKNRYWRVARLAERRIDRAFAISAGLETLYTGLGICDPETTELIHYGFRFDDAVPFEDQYRFGNPQLCIVGRLTAFKGHRFALEALEQLKGTYPEIRLVIVGWGELEEELKRAVAEKQLTEYVVFTGFQPNPRSYMVASDIVLLPSVSEGFGIVIAEAMSARRPIVAFDVPSPSELLEHGFSGLLAKPYDTTEYARLVAGLIEHPEERAKLAQHALHVLQTDYALDRMTTRLEQFYRNTVHA